jgi:hypothetical protein
MTAKPSKPTKKNASATMVLTREGKARVARTMVRKGINFYAASALLRRHGGDPFVVEYLLCQGVEVFLKGCFASSTAQEPVP